MERCLYCYKELKEGQVDYHPACARKLFGTRQAPQLPYVRSEIGELAKQVVRAQTTLTGVQAKLSLDVNLGGKNEPASTAEAEVRAMVNGNGGNIAAAKIVGTRLAEKAKAAGIETCAFDRSGYRYHGRVAALAEAAREAGLKF